MSILETSSTFLIADMDCMAFSNSLTEWTAKSTEVSTMRSTVTVLSREMDRFCFSVIHATTSLNTSPIILANLVHITSCF